MQLFSCKQKLISSARVAVMLIIVTFSFVACSPQSSLKDDTKQETQVQNTSNAAVMAAADTSQSESNLDNPQSDSSVTNSAQSSEDNSASASANPPSTQVENVPDIVAPPRVVESCKKEPYIKYEAQARASIATGWEATKAEKYGVGFRNPDEYKKWSNTHNSVFKKVSLACEELSKCAQEHKQDSHKFCADLAKNYAQWQNTAENFASKIQTVETGQPPKLCSLAPSKDDPSKCYDLIADNIDTVCKSEQCQEVSECWRGIAFLDAAISQSEQSCGFVHQKLNDCPAYLQSTGRRSAEFQACENLHGNLDIDVPPAL